MSRLNAIVEGDGVDVVLLHGWGMNSSVWSPLLPALIGRYRITRIDLPGHGASPVLASSDADAWADALLAAAPDRAIWLGWSLGGMLSMVAAERDPAAVRAVMTVASNLRFVAAHDWPMAVSEALLGDMVEGVGTDPEETMRRFIALQFLSVRGSESIVRHLRGTLSSGLPVREPLLDGLSMLGTLDNRRRAARLRQPIHMVFGGRDKLVPVAVAEAVASILSPGDVSVIEGAGHAPFLTHRAEFLSLLESFLETHAR